MKTLVIAAAMLLTASLTQAQNVTVDADKKLNTDFSKYKTYVWASQVDSNLDPGFYFLNDLKLKERIRNAVRFSMDGRDYKYTRQTPFCWSISGYSRNRPTSEATQARAQRVSEPERV